MCVWQTAETHLPLHHWNGCMKFDSQGSSSIFRRCQEKAGEEPSSWAGAPDTESVWSLDSVTPSWIALSQGCVSSSKGQPSRFSDLLRFHKSSGGAVLLAQQSVSPSIPKSGLTTPCKDWEIWDWGLDWDRRPHVLLDPSENDVITGERRRDKEILLRRHDCFFRCLIPCVIQELLL